MGVSNAVLTIPLAQGHLHGAHAPTPGVFALSGSFRTQPAGQRDTLLQRLVVSLVAGGSRRRDPFEMFALLENRGATFMVSSDANRIRFNARACTADLTLVVQLLGECLREPRFDAAEVAIAQAQLIAELRYQAAEPMAAAADAFARGIYAAAHPGYPLVLAEQVALVEAFTLDDVHCYHREQFGANDLHVAVAGDIDPHEAARGIDCEFAQWPSWPVPEIDAQSLPARTATTHLHLSGQICFGVVLGQPLQIRYGHPDYTALWLANQIFGGTFASRLVATVREEMGLAYSIRSELSRPDRTLPGHWKAMLLLAPDALQDGIAATRASLRRFVENGAAPDELATQQRAAIGAFQIGLASLDGFSTAILSAAELQGCPLDLGGFERRLQAVTSAQINRVIREHLQPDQVRIAMAGPSLREHQSLEA